MHGTEVQTVTDKYTVSEREEGSGCRTEGQGQSVTDKYTLDMEPGNRVLSVTDKQAGYRQGWAKLVLIALERYSVALKRLTFNLR